MGLQEELDALYRRIGVIKREMAAKGGPIYGPPAVVSTIIEDAAREFERVGMGPIRTERYRRALTEVSQYGPLGFLQRDARRINEVISRLEDNAQLLPDQLRKVSRADWLAGRILSAPVAEARRLRQGLQRIAKQLGVEMEY